MKIEEEPWVGAWVTDGLVGDSSSSPGVNHPSNNPTTITKEGFKEGPRISVQVTGPLFLVAGGFHLVAGLHYPHQVKFIANRKHSCQLLTFLSAKYLPILSLTIALQ